MDNDMNMHVMISGITGRDFKYLLPIEHKDITDMVLNKNLEDISESDIEAAYLLVYDYIIDLTDSSQGLRKVTAFKCICFTNEDDALVNIDRFNPNHYCKDGKLVWRNELAFINDKGVRRS